METLLREHVEGTRDHGHRLWCLVMLELWLRVYVESSDPPASARDARALGLAA